MTVYDVIVIGAGVEGSATAYNAIRRRRNSSSNSSSSSSSSSSNNNLKVMLIEQFPLPHNRGSSHGQTRVTRKAYPETFYTHMMNFCTEEWNSLQEKAGESIKKQIGYLAIGELNGVFLKNNMAAMDLHGAPYTAVTPEEFKVRFPMLRYSDQIGGVVDPEGGTLMADKALKAMQTLFCKHGGVIQDGEPVARITPGEIIQVTTSKGRYHAKSVVLCCGPWTNKVLGGLGLQLPLKPIRITVSYWPEKHAGSHSEDKLPTFFEENCCGGYSIYGLPSEEYPGHVKLCLHHGPDIDPDLRDSVDHDWVVKLLSPYVRNHFPGLEPKPSILEPCIYTNTPDKHFILDCHPKWKNIVIGAGFSGHGFKLSPAVGEILTDLALGQASRFDLKPFTIARFSQTRKANL